MNVPSESGSVPGERNRLVVLPVLAMLLLLASSCGITTARPPGARRPRPTTTTSGPLSTSVPTTASVPTATTAPPTTVSSLPPPAAGFVVGRVTVVGDSVTIDAEPDLRAFIHDCQVEADVGEQWENGVELLQRLRAAGQLGAVVVIALGTNGPVTPAGFAQMMSALRGASRVVIVTDHAPRPWEAANDALFKSEVAHYPKARIADWNALADEHPSWLYSDGTHMPIGGPGAKAYAELVKEEI